MYFGNYNFVVKSKNYVLNLNYDMFLMQVFNFDFCPRPWTLISFIVLNIYI
jgi:hypothetical protein